MNWKTATAASMLACVLTSAAVAADGDTTIGGRGFFDLTNVDESNDGVASDASGTGFDVKRFYLIVGHTFDKTWSANLTTDFNYVANDAETQVFVKKAYFEGKFSDAFTLRVGSADVPLLPFVESLSGYRYIEQTLLEHIGQESSADWGVHALGAFGGGKAHYAVSAISGSGYKNPSRSQTLDLDSRIDFEPVDGLTLALFYRTGKRGLEKESLSTLHTAERTEIMAAYVKPKFRIGLEYFQADNWNQVLSPLSDKGDGYSLWGSVAINKTASVFARYDNANPSKDLAPLLENTYYNLGVAFKVMPKLDLAVVWKHDEVANGTLKTSNATLTGGLIEEGKHDEIGLWAQVSF